MEKYSNRRAVRRVGGRFAKPLTLQEQGYAVNTSRVTCQGCQHQFTPILIGGNCPKCRLPSTTSPTH